MSKHKSTPTFKTLRTRRALIAACTVFGTAVALTVAAITASAGPVGNASGFEDDDGNLVVNSTFDWNGFSPVTWTGTAPNQTATKIASGWTFTGLTDAQASTSDSGYAGGVKQDVDCATIKGSKAPNKDDLKRIYLSTKTVNGHVYLNLGWMRIPQNTVNASAHVGFEFNQSKTACGSSSDGLVQRTAGDLLLVYDFEGSASGAATLTLRKWVTSGACEISSDSAPCWGPATDLTASGFAEAQVNTAAVTDTVAPTTDTLQKAEFGEAGVDLTAAGVFQSGVCTAFGQAEGVSRSSGNSGQAAMEDLVGPGHINLTNCGTVTIIKNTDPRGINQDFSYTSTLAGSTISCSPDTSPASFTLNDGASTTNTEECANVPIGGYTVTEGAEPSGFALESLTCTATGTGSGSQDATNPSQADITIAAGLDHVTCTYVNQQQLGAIKITKTSSKAAATPLTGAQFSITSGGTPISGSPFTTGSDGTVCVDHLGFGDYSVTETTPPTGYAIDDTTAHTVSVGTNSTCGDGHEATFSATDTPLTDITATATSEVTGGTASHIACRDSANNVVGESATGNTDPASASANGLKPGTYTCTIVIDP
ncbi:MAG TPA: prealbumin-like fold domain-containing protein [Mycobacterium sp.]|nr:prealbumin-like fold domain-containing protein [Mycobacterium sp.]